MKFVIIYSDGPMGSSVLAALIEKYGFINLPFRKFFLSDYLMGEKSLEDKAMQHRFLERINQLSNPEKSGGVSVLDRNKRPKIIRTKKPSKEQIKSFLSYTPNDISSLITHCFEFANHFTIYKDKINKYNGIILQEMPQFKFLSSSRQYEYVKNLKALNKTTFFVMNRDFKTWCSSLLSQQDSTKSNLSKLKLISLEKLYKRWVFIQNLTKMKDSIEINLNYILQPNTKKANTYISSQLGVKCINFNYLKKNKFDLYGSILNFEDSFIPADQSFINSNILAKKILKAYCKYPFLIRIFLNYFFNLIRMMRFFRF